MFGNIPCAAAFKPFVFGNLQAGLYAECCRVDGAYTIGRGLYAARWRGNGVDPVACMVLHDGLVGIVVEAMVAFVTSDEKVERVARGLDLVDWHSLYIYRVGSKRCCHEECTDENF